MRLPNLSTIPGFRSPLLLCLEKIGLVPPKLVATIPIDVEWPDDENLLETLTFYLFEYPSGRRDYSFYEYGKCEEVKYHEMIVPEVLTWIYGGPLPVEAVRPRDTAEVVPFTVIEIAPSP